MPGVVTIVVAVVEAPLLVDSVDCDGPVVVCVVVDSGVQTVISAFTLLICLFLVSVFIIWSTILSTGFVLKLSNVTGLSV